VRLIRVADNGIGSYSTLIYGDTPLCVALERSKEDPRIKPISPGTYQCARGMHRLEHMDHDFETFEILVPGHTGIVFHWGNLPTDSKMCVLLGMAFNRVLGQPGISESRNAFARFMEILKLTDRFQLSIVEAFTREVA